MSSEMYAQDEFIDVTRTGQARQTIGRLMTEQKNRAADGLQRLAYRVRTPAIAPSEAAGQLARYRNGAAAGLDSMATYVRTAEFPAVLRDAGQFARRPEVLVVGAFLTGFLVARFVRSPRRVVVDESWRAAAGRWRGALQKGAQIASAAAAQAASSAADTLRQTAESRSLNPATVVEIVSGSRLGKPLAVVGDRLLGGTLKAARRRRALFD